VPTQGVTENTKKAVRNLDLNLSTSIHHQDIARAADPALWAHEAHLRYRFDRYTATLAALEAEHGSLEAAAAGHTRFGLVPDPAGPPGAVRYREWAPGATGATLVGDFDDCGRGIVLTPDPVTPGVWTASLHASTIPHAARLRLRLRHPGGWTVDVVPAWARQAVPEVGGGMGARYEGVHWDPPAAERHAWVHAPPLWPRTHPATGAPAAPRIYEAHVGMAGEAPTVSTYDHFREAVLPRIVAAGYTHVQLMGVAEHAYYGSFGYQVTSPFAVSSRCGSPEAFKALVDAAHGLGLCVLMDLVHAHVSSNATDSLAGFDFSGQEVGGGAVDGGGSAPPPPDASAYCVPGPPGTHPAWGTRLLAYDRPRVLEYLLSNVRFWAEEFKIDGFRFDGVTSMLYRHHGVGLGFSGDYREYFSPAANVEAAVYLMLANELCARLGRAQGRGGPLLTVAEDVSGMPALGRPVAEGGVGFGARLAMGIPDLWARLARDSAPSEGPGTSADALATRDARVWDPATIAAALTNRRYTEETIAYVECHDQSMVGDAPLAWRLMGEAMYEGMSALDEPTPVIARGVALHKVARLATLALGGDGWLSFMGDEWGHPEWVDFPREGNAWSHVRAKRSWSLVDAPHLRYAQLQAWDAACMALEAAHGFLGAEHQVVSLIGGGGEITSTSDPASHVIVAERGSLLFVFNLSPTVDLTGFRVGVGMGGTYRVALASDDAAFGGQGRVGHGVDHFTTPAYEEGGFNGRPHWMQVCAPARTAVAYVREEEA
jgi:1,4-alpha-glucan branching enzyme